MKISIIQPDLKWENKAVNFRNLDALISTLNKQSDIVILPEMFNTGFSMNPEYLCESPFAETYNWMKEKAHIGGFGICGSYIVKENNTFFNRWVFVSPDSDSFFYDKRHLFGIGDEDKFFSVGKSRVVFNFRGIRISPYICYDLRFPVWSRNRNDYDLAIYAANWPRNRSEVWNILLRARAIENQCYVAGSNRIGTDGNGTKYCGDSMIINPKGELIASSVRDKESIITSELSMSELSRFRKKFPVFNDADDFTLNT